MFVTSGLMDSVGDLSYNNDSKILEWKEPYHLNTSDTIIYKIRVAQLHDPSDMNTGDTTVLDNTTNNTFIDLTGPVDDHFSYTVSVWAVNIVGQSEAAVIQIPQTKSELLSACHNNSLLCHIFLKFL